MRCVVDCDAGVGLQGCDSIGTLLNRPATALAYAPAAPRPPTLPLSPLNRPASGPRG